MPKPVKLEVFLSFVDEDEEQIRCRITCEQSDVYTAEYVGFSVEQAFSQALDIIYNCGDLGDLYWSNT